MHNNNLLSYYSELKERVSEYIDTAYSTNNIEFNAARRKLIEDDIDGPIFREPSFEPIKRYVETNISAEDLLNKIGLENLTSQEKQLAINFLKSFDPIRYTSLYEHQLQSVVSSLNDKKNIVVTTGTGSGKSFCFQIPLILNLLSESFGSYGRKKWIGPSLSGSQWWKKPSDGFVPKRRSTNRMPAVRGLIMYPLNALVQDQVDGLRGILNSESANNLYKDSLGNERIFLQSEVDSFPHLKLGSVSGWDEINQCAVSALQAFSKLKKHAGSSFLGSEKKLVSKDEILVGKPDFFMIMDGTAYLKEYKTSSLFEVTGEIKAEYKEQVLFYAVLLYENFSINNVFATLISTRDGNYKIEISQENAFKFKADVYESIQKANEKISIVNTPQKLSRPNHEACRFCEKKIICRLFKKNQKNLELTKDVFILEGKVISVSENTTPSLSTLKIQEEDTKDIKEIIIPIELSKKINLNHCYVLSDLYYQSENFRWGEKSRIYHG